MTIPTLKQLNDETCSHNALLILRSLNTSDLTFSYMLFSTEALKNILAVTGALVSFGELTKEEFAEFESLRVDIQEYISSQEGN